MRGHSPGVASDGDLDGRRGEIGDKGPVADVDQELEQVAAESS